MLQSLFTSHSIMLFLNMINLNNLDNSLFISVLNMSFTGSIVILFVILARLLLKKAPKVFSYALWSVVLFRLICPFSFQLPVSFLNIFDTPISQTGTIEYIGSNIVSTEYPTVDTHFPKLNETINSNLPEGQEQLVADPLETPLTIASSIWIIGIIIILIYSVVSLFKIKNTLKNATLYRDNIYLCNNIATPFVMGIVHPKIYLPETLSKNEQRYIVLHEQIHIKRFDHIIKFISFFTACIHWFNPLVWIAFALSSKDMEMSCDELVIKKMGNGIKKDYSSSLLSLATGKTILGASPLAFGEGDTKSRIKNVLNYKKPRFWVTILIFISVIGLSIGLMANPIKGFHLKKVKTVHINPEWFDKIQNGSIISGENEVKELSSTEAIAILKFTENIMVNPKELSLNREGGSTFHQVAIAYNSDEYNLYLNFNKDFSQVWVDNTIKPSFVYSVIDPMEVENFFKDSRYSYYDSSCNYPKDLWVHRTEYVGDNNAVGNIISGLNHPSDLTFNIIELHTEKEPYGIEIIYNTTTETLMEYDYPNVDISIFRKNAAILFALVGNVDEVKSTLTDGEREVGFINSRDWAESILGSNPFEDSETLSDFESLITKIHKEISTNN